MTYESQLAVWCVGDGVSLLQARRLGYVSCSISWDLARLLPSQNGS